MRLTPLFLLVPSVAVASPAHDLDGDGFDDGILEPNMIVHGGAKGAVLGPGPVSPRAPWLLVSDLALVGDLDGDGYADVVLGDPGCANVADDLAACGTGAIHVFRGGPKGLAAKPSLTRTSAGKDTMFGARIVAVGDVTGDGRADLVVADKTGGHLYAGSAQGLVATSRDFPADQVAAAGDLDGDKRADLVVATPGKLAVWSGADPARATVLVLPANTSFAGVTGFGDFDGDGFGDLAVGLESMTSARTRAPGVVAIYRGSARGVSARPSQQLTRGDARAGFGGMMASVGDLDGDRRDDLVIGAPCTTFDAKRSSCEAGSAYVFLGGARGFPALPAHALSPPRKHGGIGGTSLSALGDVDGDKRPDFAFGAYLYRGGKGGLVDPKPPSW